MDLDKIFASSSSFPVFDMLCFNRSEIFLESASRNFRSMFCFCKRCPSHRNDLRDLFSSSLSIRCFNCEHSSQVTSTAKVQVKHYNSSFIHFLNESYLVQFQHQVESPRCQLAADSSPSHSDTGGQMTFWCSNQTSSAPFFYPQLENAMSIFWNCSWVSNRSFY